MSRSLALYLLSAILIVPVAGCSLGGGPQRLAPTEVRQYKGARLDSVDDFRENSIKGPQSVDLQAYRLAIRGEVQTPRRLTYTQVTALPSYEKVVTLNCVEGWSVRILWEGVRLTEVLDLADYDSSAKVVIFRCEDGYSTSLPLDYIRENDILLAYRMNGVELPEERGFPFQVVAEDKWGYKWAKWVTEIEVSNDTRFQGYWEQRGYDNEADLPSAEK